MPRFTVGSCFSSARPLRARSISSVARRCCSATRAAGSRAVPSRVASSRAATAPLLLSAQLQLLPRKLVPRLDFGPGVVFCRRSSRDTALDGKPALVVRASGNLARCLLPATAIVLRVVLVAVWSELEPGVRTAHATTDLRPPSRLVPSFVFTLGPRSAELGVGAGGDGHWACRGSANLFGSFAQPFVCNLKHAQVKIWSQ